MKIWVKIKNTWNKFLQKGETMNITDIIIKSLWVIPSFFGSINGLGFIYMGYMTNNRYLLLEGIIYELPWLLILFFTLLAPDLISVIYLGLFASLLQLVSIIRSFWVDYKYIKLLHGNEKYLNA